MKGTLSLEWCSKSNFLHIVWKCCAVIAVLHSAHNKLKLLVFIMDIDFGSNSLSYHACCYADSATIWGWCAAVFEKFFFFFCNAAKWLRYSTHCQTRCLCWVKCCMCCVLNTYFEENGPFVSLRRSQVIGRFEEGQPVERMDTSSSHEPAANTRLIQRQGRSERRYLANKHVCYSFC